MTGPRGRPTASSSPALRTARATAARSVERRLFPYPSRNRRAWSRGRQVPRQLAVGRRLFASLGQRQQPDAAESQLAAAATNDQPLNPAPGSAGLHVQVQPVAVSVSSRRSGTHEGSRQGLVGMVALGFGFFAEGGRYCLQLHSPTMWGARIVIEGEALNGHNELQNRKSNHCARSSPILVRRVGGI